MDLLQYRILKKEIVFVVIASLSVCSTSVADIVKIQSLAPDSSGEVRVLVEDEKKVKVSTEAANKDATITLEEPPFVVSDPSVTTVSGRIDGMTWLYIGGAIGAAAIAAVALGAAGSGGSSSDSGVDPVPPPTTPVVGPDLNGTNWSGYLTINDSSARGSQNITASIMQSGASITIITSSTLAYGHRFDGRISRNGNMLVYDSITGEDWSTHVGTTSANHIDLYDYVNGKRNVDRMVLNR